MEIEGRPNSTGNRTASYRQDLTIEHNYSGIPFILLAGIDILNIHALEDCVQGIAFLVHQSPGDTGKHILGGILDEVEIAKIDGLLAGKSK